MVSTTKTGQERRVGIGPGTVEVLRHHRARQREERRAASAWAAAIAVLVDLGRNRR